jgi:hypothetical protein
MSKEVGLFRLVKKGFSLSLDPYVMAQEAMYYLLHQHISQGIIKGVISKDIPLS